MTPLLEVRKLTKTYPGVVALSEVDFDLRGGEVHALVGENGAGKSTLSRIIAGITAADGGEMRLRGEAYRPGSRRDAEHHGVRMVMQELNLIANLTVAENIFIDRMPRRLGIIRYGKMNAEAREVLAKVGVGEIPPDRYVRELGIGQQQMVEIAAGLSRRCDLLILDEPTAALTDRETDLLFEQIRRLKGAGSAILYISHRMEEIKRIADRITVLRDGRLVSTHDAGQISIDRIIALMVGREVEQALWQERPRGRVALSVRGLRRGEAVRDVSFDLHCGEILGFAGLMGSGRTETMRAIFGADRRDGGAVHLYGSPRPARIRRPRDAVRRGMALLTEDRKQQGLFLPLSIRENTTITWLRQVSLLGTWLRPRAERTAVERMIQLLSVRCRSGEQAVSSLSGGNQQKVVIAKWLYRDCDILIFDEPTRGIDIGAKFEIYQLLAELAGRGKAIIIVSSDLKELMGICDRIAVMSAGRIGGMFNRGEWSQDKIMAAALSGYLNDDSTQPRLVSARAQ